MSRKFRKKPVVIEAIQLNGSNIHEVDQFIEERSSKGQWKVVEQKIRIPTLEGNMWASAGDWIICGVKGEFYPCKPDIFELTYEKDLE